MSFNVDIRNDLPDDAVVFDNHSYDNSIIGTTLDGRVIYAYELMVRELMVDEQWSDLDSMEWIEYNVIPTIPYAGEKAPMIVYLGYEI